MRAKVTISLPEEMLVRLDAEADALGVSRSELVQEAAAEYLGQTREQREARARRERILAAVEDMRTMADRHPLLDTRPSLEILREIRETDDSAPLRGVEGSD